MGIFENPSTWGGSTWILLHCISMTFPNKPNDADRKKYLLFLKSIKEVLPCKICRDSYKKYIRINPPNLANRKQFVHWIIDLHNYVNQKIDKPILSYKQARHEIQKFCKN